MIDVADAYCRWCGAVVLIPYEFGDPFCGEDCLKVYDQELDEIS